MESVLIKTSQNGTTWSNLQTPSSYKLEYNDLDNDSFRSVINGDLKRSRVKPRWIKLTLSYNRCTDDELDTIARAVNTNQTYHVQCKAPAFGNMGLNNTWVQFEGYTSQYSADMLPKQQGWNVSFSIIQAVNGSFQ